MSPSAADFLSFPAHVWLLISTWMPNTSMIQPKQELISSMVLTSPCCICIIDLFIHVSGADLVIVVPEFCTLFEYVVLWLERSNLVCFYPEAAPPFWCTCCRFVGFFFSYCMLLKGSLPQRTLLQKHLISSSTFNSLTSWHHPVAHSHNLCWAASLVFKNELSKAAFIVVSSAGSGSTSWPIRADWDFRGGGAWTGARGSVSDRGGEYSPATLDCMRELMCIWTIKMCI